jgi:hypothetical protein
MFGGLGKLRFVLVQRVTAFCRDACLARKLQERTCVHTATLAPVQLRHDAHGRRVRARPGLLVGRREGQQRQPSRTTHAPGFAANTRRSHSSL